MRLKWATFPLERAPAPAPGASVHGWENAEPRCRPTERPPSAEEGPEGAEAGLLGVGGWLALRARAGPSVGLAEGGAAARPALSPAGAGGGAAPAADFIPASWQAGAAHKKPSAGRRERTGSRHGRPESRVSNGDAPEAEGGSPPGQPRGRPFLLIGLAEEVPPLLL